MSVTGGASGVSGPVPVVFAAAGESWEPRALGLVESAREVTLLRRCVDLADLVAAAVTGRGRVALVASTLPGLDADAVGTLRRHDVRVVAVAPARATPGRSTDDEMARLRRLGVHATLPADLGAAATGGGPGELVTTLLAAAGPLDGSGQPSVEELSAKPGGAPEDQVEGPLPPSTGTGSNEARTGRITTVWGPAGAPGRTTVAVNLAAHAAARGRDCLLVDADPYGGAVAQHLGVLDETSGLLAATRAGNHGTLDGAALASACRGVGSSLRVLTGLPRPDRWVEVREVGFHAVLDAAVTLSERVVLDVGFDVDSEVGDPFAAAPPRSLMTTVALDRADTVVVVGAADPVGLARLARGLALVAARVPGTPVHVVVNRLRPTLAWSRTELDDLVARFLRPAGVYYLPEDRAATDRALLSGRSLVESGDSALRRATAELADAALVA